MYRTRTAEKIPEDVISMMFKLPSFWKDKHYKERQELRLKIVTDFLSSDISYTKKQVSILGSSFDKRNLPLIRNVFDMACEDQGHKFLNHTVEFIMNAIFRDSNYGISHVNSEVKTEFETKNRYYPYISFTREDFIRILWRVGNFFKTKNMRSKKFIDVGCGIGDKVLFANLLGYDSYGIEYNEHTYNLGKHFLNDVDWCRLIRGDAFSHDFSTYDVIYLYVPIADHKLMIELHKHIYSTMKAGAKIYDVGMGVRGIYRNIFGKNPSGKRPDFRGVIQKKKNGKPWVRSFKLERA